jgi:hypothetical protein
MTAKRMLLGLVAAVAMGGFAMGQPPARPVGPLSEGRELDPVTRDHYLPESPVLPATASSATDPTAKGFDMAPFWGFLATVNEKLMSQFMMPLGGVPTTDQDEGGKM